MKINKVDGVSFARKPNSKEMKVYTNALNRGLDLLDKQVNLILHNSSAPSVKKENIGIGSLFSTTTAKKLIPFLKAHAVSGIQQEPNGLRKVTDNSPYSPESSAKNIYMIPLEKLASDEYGNILSKQTFQRIVSSHNHSDKVDYPQVRLSYEIALREAYNNLTGNSELEKEFKDFKRANEGKYQQSAIYRLLKAERGEDNYKVWSKPENHTPEALGQLYENSRYENWNETDKNLFNPANEEQAKMAKARINELKNKYKNDYDYFLFQQFLLEKENKVSNELSQKTGVKIIGDVPIAQPASDEWALNSLFLKDCAIGCPPDLWSKEGQRWGFLYFKPEEIFNPDGSLGKGGEFLKQKYEEYFSSFPGGVRIDHVIGLIDPFIYRTDSAPMTAKNSGRLYSDFPEGKVRKNSTEEYAQLFTKIIIPSAEKYGLDKSSLICEDLGLVTAPTAKVMKDLELSGITIMQYDYNSRTAPRQNTIMLGSHDNKSYIEYASEILKDEERAEKKAEVLARNTIKRHASLEELEKYKKNIISSLKDFIHSSFVEIFTSSARRIQIFFTDFWGIAKTYNVPGTVDGCWSLRLGEDFEADYYKSASEGLAPNFPKIIADALRHKGLDKNNESLMKDLDNSAKIIDEA